MSAVFNSGNRETYEWTFDVETKQMKGQTADPAQIELSGAESFTEAVLDDAPARESLTARILNHMELSTILRVFGAGVMVAAIGIFLLQRWEAGSDLSRYSLLLGQTVLLSLLGFATSRFMREPKSARVFLALGLVSSAASFTVLGAMLYSTVQWDAISVAYPGFAYWRVTSLAEATSWIAGSAMLLLPVTFIGYLTLARPAAKTLTVLFVVNSALVMLPIRDPAVAAVLAASAGIMSFWVLARLYRDVPALRTVEGRVARLIALLPVAIIAGRCGYIYAASAISVASLSVLAYVTIRQMAEHSRLNCAWQRLFEVVSLAPALVAAYATASFVAETVGYKWDEELAVAALCGVMIVALIDLARRSGRDAMIYARGAALFGLLVGIAELVINPSMGTALFCALASGAVAAYTRNAGFVVLYRVSLLSMLAGLGYHVFYAIEAFDLGGWMGLAVLGISAIILAAAIERHGEQMKLMLHAALRIPAAD